MTNLPMAWTLGPAALEARREDLLGSLVRRADERLELPNGYRVRFPPGDDVSPTIAKVVEVERQCCRFLTFQVTVEPDGGQVARKPADLVWATLRRYSPANVPTVP